MKLGVDDGEGFDARPKLRGRLAYALGDGADLTVFGSEQGDDAVGFAQLVGAQDDRLVSIGLHHTNIVSRRRTRRIHPTRIAPRETTVKCTVTSIDKPTDTC